MSKGVNIRISGKLLNFVEQQTNHDGIYESTSEYVRDLIRQDLKKYEDHKWQWLHEQLKPGMEADKNEFVLFDANEIINEAKKIATR